MDCSLPILLTMPEISGALLTFVGVVLIFVGIMLMCVGIVLMFVGVMPKSC